MVEVEKAAGGEGDGEEGVSNISKLSAVAAELDKSESNFASLGGG